MGVKRFYGAPLLSSIRQSKCEITSDSLHSFYCFLFVCLFVFFTRTLTCTFKFPAIFLTFAQVSIVLTSYKSSCFSLTLNLSTWLFSNRRNHAPAGDDVALKTLRRDAFTSTLVQNQFKVMVYDNTGVTFTSVRYHFNIMYPLVGSVQDKCSV